MELAMELLDEGTHEGVYEYQRKDSSGQVVQWDDAADDSEFVPDYVIHDCRPLRMEGDEADDPQAGDDLYAFFIQNHLPILVLSGDGQDTKARQDPYLSHPPVAWFDKANLGLATYQRAVGAYRYFQASQTAE